MYCGTQCAVHYVTIGFDVKSLRKSDKTDLSGIHVCPYCIRFNVPRDAIRVHDDYNTMLYYKYCYTRCDDLRLLLLSLLLSSWLTRSSSIVSRTTNANYPRESCQRRTFVLVPFHNILHCITGAHKSCAFCAIPYRTGGCIGNVFRQT